MRKAVMPLVFTVGLLAVWVVPADAASTSDDYGVTVNQICVSANAQLDPLEQVFEQTTNRLLGHKVSDRKFAKLSRRFERIEVRFREQFSAIFHTELDQLNQVSPAPGDESLVADWLGTRELLLNLYDQSTQLSRRILRLNVRSAKGQISFRALFREVGRINKQSSRISAQYLPLSGKDFDLGTQLGATSCVTDGSGLV